ncbi:hypothetical protein [Marinibactrum halimedae]|uniref:Lipoprotein n=1 Tax=Marinibactrum halimedae TaxID=1444977 RepID=A0AA37T5W9_9GAMM|nr:hypothetical protein [Marinibactrum halimedae]MCD9457563.1 hypothetical protein [Marinibactrum halimedae]GLS27983.1 hypothetical protein GCM10007877_37020 [Marinibactrum halimedae]
MRMLKSICVYTVMMCWGLLCSSPVLSTEEPDRSLYSRNEVALLAQCQVYANKKQLNPIIMAVVYRPNALLSSASSSSPSSSSSLSHFDYDSALRPEYCEFFTQEVLSNGEAAIRILYVQGDDPIAEKVLIGDFFTINPEFLQVDYRFGELRGARRQNASWQLLYSKVHFNSLLKNPSEFQTVFRSLLIDRNAVDKRTAEATSISKTVDVIDAGFNAWVKKMWSEWIAISASNVSNKNTSPLTMVMASPLHGKAIKLKGEVVSDCSGGVLCLKVGAANTFLSWFVDPIYLEYNKNSRQLLRYQGVVNLRDQEGETMSANIIYQYF